MIWSRKPDPTNPGADRFQYHMWEGKGLVVLGRFPCDYNKVAWKMLDEAIIGASVGNKLRQDGLPIQQFHTLRLAQKSCDHSQSDSLRSNYNIVNRNLPRLTKPFLLRA